MFDAFVAFQARIQPRAAAILSPAGQTTYAELDADVNRFAHALTAFGIKRDAGVVSIDLADHYLKLVTLLALARMGVASSTADDDRADLRLSDRASHDPVQTRRLDPDWLAQVLASDAVRFIAPRLDPEGVGRVLLSSGTTRRSRRIGLSWRMIEASVRSVMATHVGGKSGRWLPFTGIDSLMGFQLGLAAWAVGATAVVGVRQDELAPTLEVLEPAVLGFTPVLLSALLAALPAGFRAQPNLRVLVSGSALPARVARDARLRLSPDVRIIFGATECGGSATADAALLDLVGGVAGYPVPGVEIAIVDAQGVPVAQGEQGEVRISSQRAATGYIGDPEETARSFHHGGFYPGDLGRLMPDGLLVIDGRLDDRMNLGGHKFQPTTLDDVALGCPGVADAAAFPVPDATGIDQCWLAVVAGEGFDRAHLIRQLEQHRPRLPRVRLAFIEQIPRNAMGKVERQRLREETMAALVKPGHASS